MAGTRRSASRFAQSITKITQKKFERILVTQAIDKCDLSLTPTIVQKLWNYCNDDGMSYGDYVEQLTYLLFLKMVAKSATLSSVATSGPPRTSSSTSSCMWGPARAGRPGRRGGAGGGRGGGGAG